MTHPLTLTEAAHAVWSALAESGPLDVADLVSRLGLDQSLVMATATPAVESGYMAVTERPREEVDPVEGAADALAAGLPERRAARLLAEAGGRLAMDALVEAARQADIPMNAVFRFGGERGWIERVKDASGAAWVVLTPAGAAALDAEQPDEQALRLALAGVRYLDEQARQGVDVERARALLLKRKELARLRERTARTLSLTEAGRAAWQAGVRLLRERNAITHDEFRSGAWQEITLRPYDVTLPAATLYPAKAHPVRKIIEETRRAFLELGFTEVASPAVEVAFWNFDALFQPQDHPARDMQDTFYMADPAEAPLPAPEVVAAVRRVHEDGGDTGSTGWGYTWRESEARRMVLRTHTTAATIRALAADPHPPRKVFCVGWTFRNETISYKHLPVFHQVDGIIIDERANLATLLGTLQAFYRKMGFDRVRFKPAFYPYTEPSVDVVVYMERRGRWIEMGGSGIFRPEVTEPLGCRHPVLAWGLGIERLAMLRLGFDDIRQLYHGGLETVEEVPLCR